MITPERLSQIERLLNTPASGSLAFAKACMEVLDEVPKLIASIRELEVVRYVRELEAIRAAAVRCVESEKAILRAMEPGEWITEAQLRENEAAWVGLSELLETQTELSVREIVGSVRDGREG